jgi:hypothetical protein
MTIVIVNAFSFFFIHVRLYVFLQLQVQTTNFRVKQSLSKSQTYNYQFQGGSSFNDTIWTAGQNSLALSMHDNYILHIIIKLILNFTCLKHLFDHGDNIYRHGASTK